MESVKLKVDLRPRSRDLLRIRSEDLAYDPSKDKQQMQELKKEKLLEQQRRLQQHQQQWRTQHKKLQRRLQRRPVMVSERQTSSGTSDQPRAGKGQHNRHEAWKRWTISRNVETDRLSLDALDGHLVQMVEAPLEAHFLKGMERKKTAKEEGSESMSEVSSVDEPDQSDLSTETDDTGELLTDPVTHSCPRFSKSSRHRSRCPRCRIFHYYSRHDHHPDTIQDFSVQREPNVYSFPSYCYSTDSSVQFIPHVCTGHRSAFLQTKMCSSDRIRRHSEYRRLSSVSYSPSPQHRHSTIPLTNCQDSQDHNPLGLEVEPGDPLYDQDSTFELSAEAETGLERLTCYPEAGDNYYVLVVVDETTDSCSDTDSHSGPAGRPDPLGSTSDLTDGDEPDCSSSWAPADNSASPSPGPTPRDMSSDQLPKEAATDLSLHPQTSAKSCSPLPPRTDKTAPDCRSELQVDSNAGQIDDGVTLDQKVDQQHPDRDTARLISDYVPPLPSGHVQHSNDTPDTQDFHGSDSQVPILKGLTPLAQDSPTHIRYNQPSSAVSSSESAGKQRETQNPQPRAYFRFAGKLGAPMARVRTGSPEHRPRNLSCSSLTSTTIQEVDDQEHSDTSIGFGLSPSATQRSHSYGGSDTRFICRRTLRREPRVSSVGSPPRDKHSGSPSSSPPRDKRSGLSMDYRRSTSDIAARITRLQDVDIVGESCKSRFPWQRDVAVQCRSPPRPIRFSRTLSGPATGPLLRTLSTVGSRQSSSPPLAARQARLQTSNRSYSQSELLRRTNNYQVDQSDCYFCHRLAKVGNDSNNNSAFPPRGPKHHRFSSIECAGEPPLCDRHRLSLSTRSQPGSVGNVDGARLWDGSSDVSIASMEYDEDVLFYLDPGDDSHPWTDCPKDYHLTNYPEDYHLTDYPEDYHFLRDDVLPSPPMSPTARVCLEYLERVDAEDERVGWQEEYSIRQKRHRRRLPRRLSSGSITSDAESEANEPDPPVARRGRRAAIYETQNCGDVSPTTLSPDISPSNSCDEGTGASNIAERLRRRRSSVDLAMNIYPGDLLVQEHHKKLIKRNTIADFYAAGRTPNGGPLPPGVGPGTGEGADVSKKGKQPFSLLKLMKTRSRESLTKLDEILKRLKPSEFKDNHLAAYKTLHWSDLIASSDKQTNCQTANISGTERKRREAVWELFKSECVFLIDHLMVIKHCFMEPLKKVQVEGSLMFAEPQDLFGNLDELSYVSYTFCKDFIAALLKEMSITDFGRTHVLLQAFQRFSAHSRDGAVYHAYCLNYTNALSYLEKLRANPEFAEFEKWCNQDPRCNRLQLTDLLVAPMQHCTKLPLLLHNVRKYTADERERQQVTESIEKVETSLKQLEEKMRWIKNLERVQEIQRQIVWPAVTELDPRCVIPESLKSNLSKQPCEKLLTCPKRQLLHEGQLVLVETPKPFDVQVFLFDDILLISKVKKIPRKSKQPTSDLSSSSQSDRIQYTVLRQPLALDRIGVHDISSSDAAANNLKHCFVLVHISRYQQITGVFTFQAACDVSKSTWLTQIRDAVDAYTKVVTLQKEPIQSEEHKPPKTSASTDTDRSRLDFQPSHRKVEHSHSFKGVPTKSRSMDAVYV